MGCSSYQQVAFRETCTRRVAPFFQDQSPGKGGVGEMQNRPYSLYPFCAVKPHSFIYSLSSPCVLVGLSLSSLVHMSVYVYCSIGKKCFPFITYVCILFHAFSLPSCYIGTGTLLID